MKTLPASKLPAWQMERAKKLHRACQRVATAIAGGESKRQAFRRVARNFTGRKFKSNPARRMALCAGSLRRLFKVWQRGGEISASLIIRFCPRQTDLRAALLVRVVEFYLRTNQPNLKAAWRMFSARDARLQKISYQKIRYHLAASGFFHMANQARTIAKAQTALAVMRLATIASLRGRLPAK